MSKKSCKWHKTGVDPWGADILRGCRGTNAEIKELSMNSPVTVHIDIHGKTFVKRYTLKIMKKRQIIAWYKGKLVKNWEEII